MSWPCEIYTRKACFSLVLSLLYCHGSALTSIHDYCRNHSFDHRDLCCKVMSLLFSTLSTFVITFLPRNKHLLILWLQSLSAVILEPRKHLSLFPVSICHEVMGPDAMMLVFWMLSFKQLLHSPLFIFIKSLFSSCSLSAIRMISAYLRLLMFLLAVLISACDSSSPAFCMIYSAYKLNKQGDNIQHFCTLLPILS